MRIIADFHIHSKYSRTTSPEMNIPKITEWAKIKGIQVMGTGDFTHPLWLQELGKYLKPVSRGIYGHEGVNFMLTAEVSNIYSKKGRTRKVHNLIFAPSFEIAEKINRKLNLYGKLLSDGRPVLGLDSDALARMVFETSDECMFAPAHAWTPHFSVFGSNSGFNSLEECFNTQFLKISAVETGLSSDPPMNWRLSQLDHVALISNSDAHSPRNIGREANVFEFADAENLYGDIKQAVEEKDRKKFLYTIEFFPEEGKYHFDGHRNCGVRLHPKESVAVKNLCPKCGRKLTLGVLHRVEELADRKENELAGRQVGYRKLIPLEEILADALGYGKGSNVVDREYFGLVHEFGSEFGVLIDVPEEDLYRYGGGKNTSIAEGIITARAGEVDIAPGFDGEYGTIGIKWQEQARRPESLNQLNLFEQ